MYLFQGPSDLSRLFRMMDKSMDKSMGKSMDVS